MAEHTPGPWIASRDPANRRHWIVYAEEMIGTPGYRYRPSIARTANWLPSDSEEEEAANAELIASAPGMATTIRTLESENAALKAELATLHAHEAENETLKANTATLSRQNKELKAELAEARKDSERLDWLDAEDYEGPPRIQIVLEMWWCSPTPVSVRSITDTARERDDG